MIILLVVETTTQARMMGLKWSELKGSGTSGTHQRDRHNTTHEKWNVENEKRKRRSWRGRRRRRTVPTSIVMRMRSGTHLPKPRLQQIATTTKRQGFFKTSPWSKMRWDLCCTAYYVDDFPHNNSCCLNEHGASNSNIRYPWGVAVLGFISYLNYQRNALMVCSTRVGNRSRTLAPTGISLNNYEGRWWPWWG